ncbi:MAG: helix-turn-helix transcriptional regulator [Tsuneonella sp.]
MPARKHREGAELEEWRARRDRHELQMAIARQTARSLSGHALLRFKEAAAFLGVTDKTLRELEGQNLPGWPMRVRLSPKVTGYRLMDLEALVENGMHPASGADADELESAE